LQAKHKALLAPRSILGIPIGIHEAAKYHDLGLTEGGPDFFRFLSLIYQQGYDGSILPLMMASAGAKEIHSSVIEVFQRKRVRIFAHNDEEGISAAKSWKAQLEAGGAEVDVWVPPRIELPDGKFTTDLNDIYFAIDFEARAQIQGLYDLLNFKVVLFEPIEFREQNAPQKIRTGKP
jgi:hypothetical protein